MINSLKLEMVWYNILNNLITPLIKKLANHFSVHISEVYYELVLNVSQIDDRNCDGIESRSEGDLYEAIEFAMRAVSSMGRVV